MVVDDYTNTRHTTLENTGFLKRLEYPWHHSYGKLFTIYQQIKKGGISFYRCALTDEPKIKNSEIPTWMFEKSICSKMKMLGKPYCDLDSLFQLNQLLKEASPAECILDENDTLSKEGDADVRSQPGRENNHHAAIRTSQSSQENMEQSQHNGPKRNQNIFSQDDDPTSITRFEGGM
ncbi:MAG: hypothetical protein JEY99_19400 [Spirochaetales bacterium]|nr:hypothetical protein [Spirochaetales bacterium]